MIRINLAGSHRRATRVVSRGPLITTTLLVLALGGGLGCWSWWLRNAVQDLRRELAATESDTQRLSASLASVEQMEARRVELQRRITLLEQIPEQESLAPVVDDIAAAAPLDLRFLELSRRNREVTIKGLASGLSTVSRFAANLQATGRFSGAVDVLDTEATGESGDQAVRFALKVAIGK